MSHSNNPDTRIDLVPKYWPVDGGLPVDIPRVTICPHSCVADPQLRPLSPETGVPVIIEVCGNIPDYVSIAEQKTDFGSERTRFLHPLKRVDSRF